MAGIIATVLGASVAATGLRAATRELADLDDEWERVVVTRTA